MRVHGDIGGGGNGVGGGGGGGGVGAAAELIGANCTHPVGSAPPKRAVAVVTRAVITNMQHRTGEV